MKRHLVGFCMNSKSRILIWFAWASILTCPHQSRAVLEKYRIGEVENVATLTRYAQQGDEDKLYEELKNAVSEYFHENKVPLGASFFLLTAQVPCNTYICCS